MRGFREKAFFVFSPYGPNADFRAKNAVFGPKSIFFPKSPKFFDTIMTVHKNHNFFVLTLMHGGPRGSRGGPFWAKKGQNPARKPENNLPSDRTATYRETEVIQSYLRTCLLYTSPSPRDLSTSRMPSSA